MKDVIFLHGGSHGSWCWAPLLAELEKHPDVGRLITLDMPGCGTKRGRDVGTLSLAAVVAELNQDLRILHVRGAVLVGHSIAGILLPMMAVADPPLFSQVVYLATSLPREGETIMEMMGSALHGQDPGHVGWPVDPGTPPAKLFETMFAPDLSHAQFEWLMGEVVRDVTPPAVAMEGATRAGYANLLPSTYILTLRDPILPPPWQRRFAERAGCTAIVEIDTPHEPFISHPVLLADVLRQVIATVP
ncbi:MAG: alpha/beta fold hydrolase [Janthinobacterium lividum]